MGVGEAHIKGYNSHPECEVIALCDFDEDVRFRISNDYPNTQVVGYAEEILDNPDIDIVSIASYDNFHTEQILLGIRNEKHLFVEKPICLQFDDAISIATELSKHPSLQFSSNLILRKSERFIDLRERIQREELGTISNIKASYNYGRIEKITSGWRGDLDYYSAVCGGGVHMIDLITWLTNFKVTDVGAFGNNLQTASSGFKYNDVVSAILKFENEATASLITDLSCVHPHFHQLEIYGTKGTFINSLEKAIIYTERDKLDHTELDTDYPGIYKGDLLNNFIFSIIENHPPSVSKEDIFNTMSVCFAIDLACQTGQIQTVKYLPI